MDLNKIFEPECEPAKPERKLSEYESKLLDKFVIVEKQLLKCLSICEEVLYGK